MTGDEFPFEFQCQRSGNCCARPHGIVRVTPADVAAIAVHLGLSEMATRARFVAPPGDRLKDGLGSRCVFLDDVPGQAACAIYPVRPEQCRTWPYWPELRDQDALAQAMRVCPGISLRAQGAPRINPRG